MKASATIDHAIQCPGCVLFDGPPLDDGEYRDAATALAAEPDRLCGVCREILVTTPTRAATPRPSPVAPAPAVLFEHRYSVPFAVPGASPGERYRLLNEGDAAAQGMLGYHRWVLQVERPSASCPCRTCTGGRADGRHATQWTYRGHVFLRGDESSLELAGRRLVGPDHGVALRYRS